MRATHRFLYHSPAPSNLVLILGLGALAWLVLSVAAYLCGVGALTLLEMVGLS